eukprot:scaffold127393_cov63-Phaeocystis_antarctica.AAC.4
MASEARQQAQAEELTLLVVENSAGYFGVCTKPSQSKPYQAHVWRGGKTVHLGSFATAEEAALCIARSPEGQAAAERAAAAAERAAAAAERAAAAALLTNEEVRQQAQAEGLTLLVGKTKAGYYGVSLDQRGQPKPYLAHVRRGGKQVHLGSFATAVEAALHVARTPEGRAAAGRAASAESQGTLPAVPSGASLKEEGTVPPMPPGTFVKEEGAVPPMPPDAFVKVEVVVKEEEGCDSRPKRQRAK